MQLRATSMVKGTFIQKLERNSKKRSSLRLIWVEVQNHGGFGKRKRNFGEKKNAGRPKT